MEKSYIKRFEPLWDGWYVKGKLGSGSYGSVWEVYQPSSGKKAAVKEILVPDSEETLRDAKLEGMDPESVKIYFRQVLERTRREADLMKRINDCEYIVSFMEEQICELTKEQEFGWAYYIRMEELIPIKEIFLNQILSLDDVIKIGSDLCEALKYCEKHGIIHQDIKPDNLFYDPVSDRYKLGDFGIAQFNGRATAKKGRPGTLSYMSPEVYAGADSTHALDLYAVGMVLYRLLNHFRMPFLPPYPVSFLPEQRNEALMKRLKGAEPELPMPDSGFVSKEQAGVRIHPDEKDRGNRLCQIVRKSISADLQNRYKNAADLKQALQSMGKTG